MFANNCHLRGMSYSAGAWYVRVCCKKSLASSALKPRVSEAHCEGETPPWAFGFQLNERYLDWDSAAHVQLLKIACAEKLDVDIPAVEERLTELAALVPDLPQKLGKMKATVLLRLLSDTEALARKLGMLRELLPSTDASKLVSRQPAIVLDYEPEILAQRLDILREAFGSITDVEALVAREPALLQCATSQAAITDLVQRVSRMLPGQDELQFIVNNPGLVLDMEASNLPSAIDGDLTQDSPWP